MRPVTHKPLLDTVLGRRQERPPIWIMRQAGRYLPEYRQTRTGAKDFLELCYTPDLAVEVTLQPLRRFDLDAAILFSDILVIPDALGQKVRFATGEGPLLEALDVKGIDALERGGALDHLAPVLETVRRLRAVLPAEKTLIGFCGAPWTVATYMLGGRGSPDQWVARKFALEHPEAFDKLIDILVATSIDYLVAQFEAGADVVQIFESWALNLDDTSFARQVMEPNRRIVEGVRQRVPNAPIIGFPRGAAGNLERYAAATGVNALGIDFATPLDFVRTQLPPDLPVQGNLDPLRLVVGGEAMESQVRAILSAFDNRPHIFNLGHGIVPETPIAHVERLVELVKRG
ncbi:uroporphyrinogen decarboxylase [Devosia sp. XJ19-1]|uniref:Uroporphyrinogen decarboxylase n=1 Tax=Devosia ureilytica TaxID=2952754 RepID=A0A9Q4AMB3_9HYPH|nr:uroporphyrinogen decarboxylase [Devosia ureilytica]MCP8882894.1 uroporphyrinogen decarboxylase [Devosia ureilytica]MCP8886738.1 uroporphyrinogen decarboxylase [Devosia ureilytica]